MSNALKMMNEKRQGFESRDKDKMLTHQSIIRDGYNNILLQKLIEDNINSIHGGTKFAVDNQ